MRGDIKTGNSTVADNAHLDIQPASGEEWTIVNLFREADVELEWFDGTNVLTFEQLAGRGWIAFTALHVTNANRVRVKNVSGDSQRLGYTAVVTKGTG